MRARSSSPAPRPVESDGEQLAGEAREQRSFAASGVAPQGQPGNACHRS